MSDDTVQMSVLNKSLDISSTMIPCSVKNVATLLFEECRHNNTTVNKNVSCTKQRNELQVALKILFEGSTEQHNTQIYQIGINRIRIKEICKMGT